MLPSPRDRLLVGLAPDRVAIIKLKPGKRLAPDMHGVRSCVEVPGASWGGALSRLDWMLDQLSSMGGIASVVLSNQFVRYVDVPWTDGVYQDKHRLALATDCFRAIHGDVVDSWRVVLAGPSYGGGSLAAAVDDALVDSLVEVLARRQWRLGSLRPHLAAAFDRWRSRLDEDDDGFVVVEPGCITALFRRGAAWNAVDNRRYRRKNAEQAVLTLRQCIDADHLQGGTGSVALLAPGTVPDARGTAERPLRRLTGSNGPWPNDPWRALAWSAA